MKIQKPIDYDIHLKYCCKNCNQFHWLSFKEASTKNFKIVCDCGEVFMSKRVKSFKISYVDRSKSLLQESTIKACVNILIQYGYSEEESIANIKKAYEKTKIIDIPTLVKTSLQFQNLEK